MKLTNVLSLLDTMDQHNITPNHQLFKMLLPVFVKNVDTNLGRQLHVCI